MKTFLLALLTLTSTTALGDTLKDYDKIKMIYNSVSVYEFIGAKAKIVYEPATSNGVAMYKGVVEITLKIEGYLCDDIKTLGTSYYEAGQKTHLNVVIGTPYTEEIAGCAAASMPTLVVVPVFIYEPEFPGRVVEKSLGVITARNLMTGSNVQTEVIFKAKGGKSNLLVQQLK